MLAFLFYRRWTQRAPSAVLIVKGDEQWDGTRLIVQGGEPQVRYAETLSAENKFSVTFFLQPGHYTLHVANEVREQTRVDLTFNQRQMALGVDLTKSALPPPHPTTKPTSQTAEIKR